VLANHETLRDYIANSPANPESFWANLPKYMVSYLKSMYGENATAENDFGYHWHPRILGDHSHLASFEAMNEGRIKGMLLIGQNPATSLNGYATRKALGKLEWLAVKDNFLTESANFWKNAPEVRDGEVRPEDIQTEIFFFPSAQIAEEAGSFTNTQRLVQWHERATLPPGDCRDDIWFTYQLGKRLKALYADSTESKDEGFLRMTFDFDHDNPEVPGEPDPLKVLKEINGYWTDDPSRHLTGFGEMRDDGSTTGASWIYCGIFPSPDNNRSANKDPRNSDPLDHTRILDDPNAPGAYLNWGFAWPANRRVIYNRASSDPQARPWSDRKRWVWWDANLGRWVGYDVPDYAPTKRPDDPGDPNALALGVHPGSGGAYLMNPYGVGQLFVPAGMVDGPLPTHYEPVESVVQNPLYRQQVSPVYKHWGKEKDYNQVARVGDPNYPFIMTNFRLTEHYLSGTMSRWLPWLSELQPELFIEIGKELAREKGIANLDWVRISTPRRTIRAKALVTDRIGTFTIDGQRFHHVGMPWHWGYEGLSRGDVVNDLTSWVGDPNVSIHEGKSLVCNVEKA
jgi:formate dehydrogenase major subunit